MRWSPHYNDFNVLRSFLHIFPPLFQSTFPQLYISLQDQRVQTLLARLGASEKALAELEKTATDKIEGLAQQSSHGLDKLQRQLSQASSQVEQLRSFIMVRVTQ